jgi:hypothetical protein
LCCALLLLLLLYIWTAGPLHPMVHELVHEGDEKADVWDVILE